MKKKQITNFALNPNKETLRQFKECYSESYVEKAALMPDAHVGYVAPIQKRAWIWKGGGG